MFVFLLTSFFLSCVLMLFCCLFFMLHFLVIFICFLSSRFFCVEWPFVNLFRSFPWSWCAVRPSGNCRRTPSQGPSPSRPWGPSAPCRPSRDKRRNRSGTNFELMLTTALFFLSHLLEFEFSFYLAPALSLSTSLCQQPSLQNKYQPTQPNARTHISPSKSAYWN